MLLEHQLDLRIGIDETVGELHPNSLDIDHCRQVSRFAVGIKYNRGPSPLLGVQSSRYPPGEFFAGALQIPGPAKTAASPQRVQQIVAVDNDVLRQVRTPPQTLKPARC